MNLNGVYKPFLIFYFHLKTLYSTTVVTLHICILHIARIPGVASLQILAKHIILYRFYKSAQNLEFEIQIQNEFDCGADWLRNVATSY
jgi:hypothetical protein